MNGVTIGPYHFRPGILPTVVTAAVLAALIGLGVWQLDRAAHKTARIEQWQRRGALAPQLLGPRELTEQEREARLDAPVIARGRYDAGRQFLLDNRTEEGRAGFHVLTPLRLEATAGPGPTWGVLVNRGWVPVGARRDELPALPAPAGLVEVSGIGAPPREDQLILGAAGYAAGGWPRVVQRIQIASMERLLGYRLQPIVLHLAPDTPGGYVRSWRPHLGISPERHLAYAFQWFALAVALAVIYVTVNTRRSEDAGEATGPVHGEG